MSAKTKTSALGVAVWGTGSIGQKHLTVLKSDPALKPVAIPVRAERIPELNQMGFDAVDTCHTARQNGAGVCVIATDTARHADDAIEALKQDMDLLIEKPMAVDGVSALNVLKKMGPTQKAFVGCCLRFSESLLWFRDSLSELGALESVRIQGKSYLPDWRPQRDYKLSYSARAQEGGVLRDLIHEVDYATWLFGWPQELTGQCINTGQLGIEAEEKVTIQWTTLDGVSVSIELDYLTKPTQRGLQAVGQNGTLVWDGVAQTVILRDRDGREKKRVSHQPRLDLLKDQFDGFLKAREGKHTTIATAQEGVKALCVCDAVRASSAQQKKVAVDYYGL